jgi:hypothetical protein
MGETVEAIDRGFQLLHDAVNNGAFESNSDLYKKYSKLRGSVICIEGIISAGKTTLGKDMTEFLNELGLEAVFYQEYVEESLLHQFYEDPKVENCA